jgi:glutamate racemase
MLGIFDSGLGGLSVYQEVRLRMPHADILYYADSAHVPYGSKPPEFIQERSLAITQLLRERGCCAVVVACNTATAAAATLLRERFPQLPIIGMEPAVKPAVAATRSGIVGVLATVGTLQSARFAALLEKYSSQHTVITQAGTGLVECVERGDFQSQQVRGLLEKYLGALLAQGADVIVLGCTHYPFLRPLVQEIVGPEVRVIDTGAAVALRLEQQLSERGLLMSAGQAGRFEFVSSAPTDALWKIAQQLLAPVHLGAIKP